MLQVNVHEAKSSLSRLLQRVEAGDEVVIARHGRPVARLVPVAEVPTRTPGAWQGRVRIGDDFDAPLPQGVADAFAGRS